MNRRELLHGAVLSAVAAVLPLEGPALAGIKPAGAVVSFYKDAVDINLCLPGDSYEVPDWVAGRAGRMTIRNTTNEPVRVHSKRYFSATLKPGELLWL